MTRENTVTLDRQVYERLTSQADAWRSIGHALQRHDPELLRLLDSPAVRDVLLAAWDTWTRRTEAAETANAISASTNWSRVGPSHATLQQRRQRPGTLHEEFTVRHGGEYRGGPVEWSTGRPATSTAHVRAA